jgi:hypothetical protein
MTRYAPVIELDRFDEPPLPTWPSDYGYDGHPDLQSGTLVPSFVIVPPLSIEDWRSRDLPEPDFLMGEWLSTTSRVLLSAATGLGKSNFGIALGMRIAAAADFLHWRAHRKACVLYIDGEMSRRLLKKRIIDEAERLGESPTGFLALSHEDVSNFAPLNTPEGQACVENLLIKIGKVDLIIFDSVMCLTAGDMTNEESWSQTMPWARSLTARNIGQIWIHHTGHDSSRFYGTNTRIWQMDTAVHLNAFDRVGTDVSFTIEFTKARERTPSNRFDFQDVQVALFGNEWTHKETETARPGTVSPLGLKFLQALTNTLASDVAKTVAGRKVADRSDWEGECVALGLIDPKAKPDSARTLFNKYRRELIAANRIVCNGEVSWLIT